MVEIASTQLKGDAIQWYDLYKTYHGVPSWGQFKREFLIRFRLSKYKNNNGQLAKIRQISTVQEYQSRFECLSNRTRDWSEIQLVRKFIEGLNPEIQCEVKARHPRTMIAVVSFASVHERKFIMDTRRNRSFNRQDFKVVNIDNHKQEQLLTVETIKEEIKIDNMELEYEGRDKLLTAETIKEEIKTDNMELEYEGRDRLLTIEPAKEESKIDNMESDHEGCAKSEDKIANGQTLICDKRCSKVKRLLVDLFLMPQEDFEVVISKRRHDTTTSHRMKRVLHKTTMTTAQEDQTIAYTKWRSYLLIKES
ncbi:hypothetical protein BHM03_00046067 [Ensete ventricosum]|nr:hypothetical protein BHM03_00046067 [Ensete ventricosum]